MMRFVIFLTKMQKKRAREFSKKLDNFYKNKFLNGGKKGLDFHKCNCITQTVICKKITRTS